MPHWAALSSQGSGIESAVVRLLDENLGLKPGERLVVLSDVPRVADWRSGDKEHLQDMLDRVILARDLAEVAAVQHKDCRVDFRLYVSTGRDGCEPVTAVADVMRIADVALAVTTHSLSHTRARASATASGTRIASLPGFEVQMLSPGGPLDVDTEKMTADCVRMAEMLSRAEWAVVTTSVGTRLTFRLGGRSGRVDTGDLRSPGSFGNLPGGEAYVAPLEGSAEGRVVVPAGWYPGLSRKLALTFEEGEVAGIEGDHTVGAWLGDLLKLGSSRATPRSRRNLAELGIGTNPGARPSVNTLESEKILGTVHLAIGDSSHIGGQVEADIHLDFVLPSPDLELDGDLVIKGGAWVC